MKSFISFMFVMFMASGIYSQGYLIEIILEEVQIVDECHFGDEWSASFSFGDGYNYQRNGAPFILESNQEFNLKSMIEEGNEVHNDYGKKIFVITYEDLEVGRNSFQDELYMEDENTGRYHCNNATFRFDYTIIVTER